MKLLRKATPNLIHNSYQIFPTMETHTANFHYYEVMKKMIINLPKYFCLAMTLSLSVGVGNLQPRRNMDTGTIH